MPEIGYTREAYSRSVTAAIARNATRPAAQARVIPWISLGCGYRREFETYEKFDLQWNVRLFCHLPAALAPKH